MNSRIQNESQIFSSIKINSNEIAAFFSFIFYWHGFSQWLKCGPKTNKMGDKFEINPVNNNGCFCPPIQRTENIRCLPIQHVSYVMRDIRTINFSVRQNLMPYHMFIVRCVCVCVRSQRRHKATAAKAHHTHTHIACSYSSDTGTSFYAFIVI